MAAAVLVAGFAFLYLPIAVLVFYSFNAGRLVTVWAGFSTRWYAALFQNQQLLDAVGVTLRVGLISATVATLLGPVASASPAPSMRPWSCPRSCSASHCCCCSSPSVRPGASGR
jgi:ABC-type spermidine/putrescine transport system permease subunit II